ncbi:MAG: hypothetical protein PWP23_1063 [Candidatus Sumerlaeota bacterium]|nr:hypothetical protein [Candidatus Sumerlaeota bacterium]
MEFPAELWKSDEELTAVRQVVDLFSASPLFLTDSLTNTVYFSPMAEELLGEQGEAIVNRAACSLLGFGRGTPVPPALNAALLGEGPAWKALVRLENGCSVACEASAIRGPNGLICGMVRLFEPVESGGR